MRQFTGNFTWRITEFGEAGLHKAYLGRHTRLFLDGGHTSGVFRGSGNLLGEMNVVNQVARDLAPYLAAKGSITVDGVSLTVNEVADQSDGSCPT